MIGENYRKILEINDRVIVLDSCENTRRSSYITEVLKHSLQKGIKIIAISELNPLRNNDYTRFYPSLILKDIAYSGRWQRYQATASKVRELIETLYYDRLADASTVTFLAGLREMLAELIQEFLEKNYYVILDRSYFSTLAYFYSENDKLKEQLPYCNINVKNSYFVIEDGKNTSNSFFANWNKKNSKIINWFNNYAEKNPNTKIISYEKIEDNPYLQHFDKLIN